MCDYLFIAFSVHTCCFQPANRGLQWSRPCMRAHVPVIGGLVNPMSIARLGVERRLQRPAGNNQLCLST